MIDYKEVTFSIRENEQLPLISVLDEIGFNSFVQESDELKAYIESASFDLTLLSTTLVNTDYSSLKYEVSDLEHKNWNEEWEKNFEPIKVRDIFVRATFHEPDPEAKLEVVIDPRMTFGTGHHSTTQLMLEALLDLENDGRQKLLDAGCGTGVLAIAAHKLGWTTIDAYDNDPNAVENAAENCEINNTKFNELFVGESQDIKSEDYGTILANINLNVLKGDIATFGGILKENGYLVLSGFYEDDAAELRQLAGQTGLSLIAERTKNNWSCLVFRKG